MLPIKWTCLKQKRIAKFKEQLAKERTDEYADELPIFPISGVTRKGIEPLLNATADLLEVTPEFPLYEDEVVEEETVRWLPTRRSRIYD